MLSINSKKVTDDSLWGNHVFLVLMSTSVLVGLGQKIFSVAIPLIVYELTKSSEWMGWMRAVEFLPNLLLALFIGVWVDKFNKKKWSLAMLITQSILLVVSFSVIALGGSIIWILFPLTFIINSCSYGYYNSKMVIIKKGIPHDMLNLATARLSGVTNFFDTLGPAIAGSILLISALHWPILWVAVAFAVSALIFSRLKWSEDVPVSNSSNLELIKEGWFVLKSHTTLFFLTWLIMIVNVTGGVFEIQMIFAAKDVYSFNNAQVGFLISAAGSGAFLGAYFAPSIRIRFGLGNALLLSVFLEACCFLIPTIFETPLAMYISMFSATGIGVITSICIWTYRQEVVSSEYFGRVAGLTGSIFKIGLPIGLAGSGYLVTLYGVNFLFVICGSLQVIAVLFFNRKMVRDIK